VVARRPRVVPTLPVAVCDRKVAARVKAAAKAPVVVKGKVAVVKAAEVEDGNHQRLDNKCERRYGSCQDLTERDPRERDR